MKHPLLLLVSLAALAAPAHATEPEHIFGPPRYARGWMHVRAGITFADGAVLGNNAKALDSNGDPSAIFGIGVHWRTSRIDLGGLFEAMASYSFSGLERDNRIGSQFRFAADLRWRYIEDSWGALFLRLTPGIIAFSHADPLRFQVTQVNGAELDSVDQYNVGFSLGFDFGVLIYLDQTVALSVDLDVVSGMTSIDTDKGEMDLDMVRGIFGIGVEWRM